MVEFKADVNVENGRVYSMSVGYDAFCSLV